MKIEWKDCYKIIISVFAIYLLINYYPVIHNIIFEIIYASMPLVIGAMIAYLVSILMDFYEKYLPLKKYRDVINILISFVTLIAIISLVVAIVVPEFISCIALFMGELPDVLDTIVIELSKNNMLSQELSKFLSSIDWDTTINELINIFKSSIGNVFGAAIKVVSSVFSGIVTGLIAIIFSIYILYNRKTLKCQFKKLFDHYLPKRVNRNICYVIDIIDNCFRRYIVGQCLEACILGTLCMIGMMIMSLPYATMIGALISLTALIPVAGAYIGAFVGAFMIMTVSPIKALVFLIFLVILQQVEGNLIYPKVVGSSIGLPSLWVLFAVTLGGGLAGVAGMLIAVPLVASVYRIIKNDIEGIYKF